MHSRSRAEQQRAAMFAAAPKPTRGAYPPREDAPATTHGQTPPHLISAWARPAPSQVMGDAIREAAMGVQRRRYANDSRVTVPRAVGQALVSAMDGWRSSA